MGRGRQFQHVFNNLAVPTAAFNKSVPPFISSFVPSLFQGEVGSGKTLVAFLAMLRATASGRQAVLMAPTEILAEQHFETISQWSEGCGIGIHLLTGSVTGGARREALIKARGEGAAIFIGTHALIQEDVSFRSIALAVVDEQHPQ